MASWLLVLSDAGAATWVLDNEKMAFRVTAHAERIQRGDNVAFYVSRSAHSNPTRDEAQIVAVGVFASVVRRESVEVAGHRFEQTCALSVQHVLPLRGGVPFRPLVDRLDFIRAKSGWAAYVRRTLVPLPDSDFRRISQEVKKAVRSRHFEAASA